MPYVNIRIAKGEKPLSKEKKAELIKETNKVISGILDKNSKATYIVIDEVDTDNWGVGEESLSSIREKQQ